MRYELKRCIAPLVLAGLAMAAGSAALAADGASGAAARAADAAEGAKPFAPRLSVPIDLLESIEMSKDAAGAPNAVSDLPPRPGATPADRALGALQRGLFRTALELAEPLAEEGDAAMQMLLAHMHGSGLGTPAAPGRAFAWLERAAANGDERARHELAIRAIEGTAGRDDGPAGSPRAVLTDLAENDRAEAAFDLAQFLLTDDRAEADRREGLARLRQAAGAGLHEAQYALARTLIETEGHETKGDGEPARRARAEALAALVPAARSGMAEAQLELGVWLVAGRAGRIDLTAALGWMERAALAGLPIARNRLAHMHWKGLGTAGDRVEAARWHLLARAGGLGDAELDGMLEGLSDAERVAVGDGLPDAILTPLVDSVITGAIEPTRRIERRTAASKVAGGEDDGRDYVDLPGVARGIGAASEGSPTDARQSLR